MILLLPDACGAANIIEKSYTYLAREDKIMEQATHYTQNSYAVPPIDAEAPKKVETATFALGSFWEPDSRFGSLRGVVRTRVGYAGGKKNNPTYRDLGDHIETVQIDYDPQKISYEELLDVFWNNHNPASPGWSRQYMNAIFYHNERQKKMAEESRNRAAARFGGKIHTEILPYIGFYRAEHYHQKYRLRNERDFLKEFSLIYPHYQELVDSTAAARVNGYLSGYGTLEDLQAEVDSFGLSPAARKKLLDIVRRRGQRVKPMCATVPY